MPTPTDNHNYDVYAVGEESPWTHGPTIEQLDVDVEIRDTDANKGNYTAKSGALYRATDTGIVYLGDGTNWVEHGALGVNIQYVSSAAEMNAALTDMATTGGVIKWLPGTYTGDDFTEMISIPVDIPPVTLDFSNVDITIGSTDPYRGADGAFIHKAESTSNSVVNIIGPHKLTIGGGFSDETFTRPHAIELYDTERCHINTWISATHVDRVLYMRQSGNAGSGHHVTTEGSRLYGGNVTLQVGSGADITGKDRCHWHGQIAGWKEAGVQISGESISNRIWAQAEQPSSTNAVADNASYRIRYQQNALMLNHIDSAHPIDIQAPNCGILAPATPGNPQPFRHSRLGVRPNNIYMPNYSATTFNFGTDWRAVLDTAADASAAVNYDAASGAAALVSSDAGAVASLQSSGAAGQMDHHVHGYADVELSTLATRNLRFGAYIDANNYALLRIDASATDPVQVKIVSGGTTLVDQSAKSTASSGRKALIAFIRNDYQAFFFDYDLVFEGTYDLSTWPSEPHLRVDFQRTFNTGDATALLRNLEYGIAKKYETA